MKREGKKAKTIKVISLLMVVLSMSGFIGIEKDKAPVESRVKWMTFEEAVEKSKTEKRKVFIDVYTVWCGWCKEMDKNTFNHEVIAAYLNEKFYPVKLDGEQKEDIIFRGTTFKFVPQGRNGYHELAAALLNGKLSYPTVVFLDENFDMLQPLPGYQKPDFFDVVLKYIGGDHYKTIKWTDFQQSYKSPF
ncbi:MAG: DUF255 domain-containing protein [Cyclobacteriaceae bacterium]|nr:DUF255 domain-containing protein [Cyclobacteriaceae bacterium]